MTVFRLTIRDQGLAKGPPRDALAAFRQSRYLERIDRERGEKGKTSVSSCAWSRSLPLGGPFKSDAPL
ncbi:MAG: hypothetical protein LAN62_15895 [Acidobacteriia bacterium]|nr:hypothetical protein [Terriglobia bacterium]